MNHYSWGGGDGNLLPKLPFAAASANVDNLSRIQVQTHHLSSFEEPEPTQSVSTHRLRQS